METEYWVQYDFGMHRVLIRTDICSFHSLVDNMSEEFCIHHELNEFENQFGKVKTILVFFYNYHDEPTIIGMICEYPEEG